MAKRTYSRGSIMKILMQAAIDDPLCAEWRAWDLMVEANKIIEFMQNDSEPIYIVFRQDGCDAGSRDYVQGRCKVLGKPILILRLSHENRLVLSEITIENLHHFYE